MYKNSISEDREVVNLEDGKNDWNGKKTNSINLSNSYKRIGKSHDLETKQKDRLLKKGKRVATCGSYLEFKVHKVSKDKKLNYANFCKDRLCQMCNWRRSLKTFGQTLKIVKRIKEVDDKYRFLFLTLTCRNVSGEELPEEITNLIAASNKMFRRQKVSNVVHGTFRALEVTHNLDKDSKSYDTYHPHLHIVVVVDNSYFKKRNKKYIEQVEWTSMWQKSLGVDYTPVVDVRVFKTDTIKSIEKSVAESAKYTVKDSDLIVADENGIDEDMTDSTVYYLDKALSGRRLLARTGLFKEMHQELNLGDTEEGDLVITDAKDSGEDIESEYILETYRWNMGYMSYTKSSERPFSKNTEK